MHVRKTCACCRISLSVTAFHDSCRSPDGVANTCRACTNARRRQHRPRTPARPPVANLGQAVRRGQLDIVKTLLDGGMTPHWGWVCEAMREGHRAVARLLLESGVESNLFTLVTLGEVAAVRRTLHRHPEQACLARDLEPNGRRVTPLHVACATDLQKASRKHRHAQQKVIAALLDHGADVNALACYRGIADATPLFCACWTSGNATLVGWLLEHGARACDQDLLAALGHFQRHGRGAYEVADLLLAGGLSVDGMPGERTPLQAFAHQADQRTVSWLLARGAEVNARGPGGWTAAHFAAERNVAPATLALLTEHGADLSARDVMGHTPLDVARRNGKDRLVAWLQERSRRAQHGRSTAGHTCKTPVRNSRPSS